MLNKKGKGKRRQDRQKAMEKKSRKEIGEKEKEKGK
jgi:hypothetical protein